jgi:hypothetical protein
VTGLYVRCDLGWNGTRSISLGSLCDLMRKGATATSMLIHPDTCLAWVGEEKSTEGLEEDFIAGSFWH